jgi:hypothetical protein
MLEGVRDDIAEAGSMAVSNAVRTELYGILSRFANA